MKPYRVVNIISPFKIIFNCGKKDGIKIYDKFIVYGLTDPINDPETGEDLGSAEIVRGIGRVVHLQERLCTVESDMYEALPNKIIKKTVENTGMFSVRSPFDNNNIVTEESSFPPKIKAFDNIEVGDYGRKQ
jgi:hypothetical protein